jgi:hypothetical protein
MKRARERTLEREGIHESSRRFYFLSSYNRIVVRKLLRPQNGFGH